jgi:hypothetical protein
MDKHIQEVLQLVLIDTELVKKIDIIMEILNKALLQLNLLVSCLLY